MTCPCAESRTLDDRCVVTGMCGKPRIVTGHIFPPIPDRSNDWCAHYAEREEAGPYGYGATEATAIRDLIDNYDAPEA